MKSLPAQLIVSVACLAGISSASARSFTGEGIGCLFQLAKPALSEPILRFSIAPLASRLALRARPFLEPTPVVVSEPEIVETEKEEAADFSVTFLRQPAPKTTDNAESVEHWAIFDALRQWQSNPQVPGLSHSFSNPDSYIALDYSDIFETGRAPYKGGHGVSLILRRDF